MLFELALADTEVVAASSSIPMLRAPVHGVSSPSTGDNHEVGPALTALQESGEEVGAGGGAIEEALSAAVELLHPGLPGLDRDPESFGDDSQLGPLNHLPFSSRAGTGNPFVRSGYLHEMRSIPNHAPGVELSTKYLANRCRRLGRVHGISPRAWRRESLSV
jgi:hypothetical protein